MWGDWPEVALEDVADEITVGYVGSMTSEYVDAGIPFLRSKNVEPLRINTGDLKFISPEFHQKIRKSRLSPGDVVIVRTGKPGSCSVIPSWLEDANCSDLVIVRCGKEINNRFLAYYVNTVASAHISAHLVGAVQQHFNVGSARTMSIRLPSLQEQKAITHVLGTLDDRIELNRQMNENLESMAQALFKSWFVDFDPVIDNALASGKEIPEELREKAQARAALGDKRQPLPAESRTLFPDEFVYSDELGWIPEGWKVAPLGDVTVELRRGISPKYTEDGGVRVVNQRCIRNHEVNYSLARRNDENKRKVEGRFLEEGDLLVNSTGVGTLGRMAQVHDLTEPSVVDSHVTIARADRSKYYPYTFARMMLSIEPYIEAMGEGSTGQTELSRKNLAQVQVIVPPMNNQNAVEDYFNDFVKKISLNSQCTDTLNLTRDTLLPKLLSGKLRIPDAEKMVEELAL